MTNIFFDFDGTIINSQHRLYNLFTELCPECKMSYEEYWKIKKQRINQKDFLKKYFNYSEEQCNKFHKNWLNEIENPKRIEQDFLIEGIEEVFKKLSKYNLYLVTNRQSRELTISELNMFGIEKYFCDILVTEQKKTKEELIKENIKYTLHDILIGDTGEDIKTAKKLGIKSIAVSWGILNTKVLEEYEPDFLVHSLNDLCILLERLNEVC